MRSRSVLGIAMVVEFATTTLGCGMETSDPVSEETVAFSAESCGSPTTVADVRLNLPAIPSSYGDPPILSSVTSERTYDTCYKSFVADVENWAISSATVSVTWGDVIPRTREACEDIEGAAMFFFAWSRDNWQLASTQRATGRWVSVGSGLNVCELPAFYSSVPIWDVRRVAATMRRISGGNPTRSVKIAIY